MTTLPIRFVLNSMPDINFEGKSPTERIREKLEAKAIDCDIKKESIPPIVSITSEAVNNGLIHGSDVVVTIKQLDKGIEVEVINSKQPGMRDFDCVREDDKILGNSNIGSCHGRGLELTKALLLLIGGTIRLKIKGNTRITTIKVPSYNPKPKPTS